MQLKFLPLTIILILLTVGLLGVFGINMTNYNGQHSCPISALSNDNCSPSNIPLAEAFHHISGLRSFAQSAVNTNASFLMLSVLLIIIFSLFGLAISKTPSLQISSHREYRRDNTDFHPPKQQFLRWLTLREKRDPHTLQWVYGYS